MREIESGFLASFRVLRGKLLSISSCMILLSSCQTIPKSISPKLPITVERLFSSCSHADGSGYLKFENSGDLNFGTEIDWVAKNEQSWHAEAYNSFGQTIGRINARLDPPNLKVSIPRVNTESLSVDEGGRLLYDGHFVGLKANEIPCLLIGKIPSDWKDNIIAYKQVNNSAEFRIVHDGRKLQISINHLDRERASFCSYYSWTEYMGLVNYKFEHCFLGKEPSTAVIQYENGVKVKWIESHSV